MPSSRRAFRHRSLRFSLLALAAAVAAAPAPAAAVALFADDVAVRTDGEFRLLYEHILEPDGDGSVRPGTVNQVQPRLRLAPELWLNEFVAIRTQVDLGGTAARWGAGQDRFEFADEAGDVNFDVGRLNLYWQTPLGTVEAGRIGWHWGLGLFQHDGRSDIDRYGVPEGTGGMDMLKVRFAPFGLNVPLDATVFVRTWYNGADNPDPFADNGWSYGLAAEGGPENLRGGLQFRYEIHRDGGTELYWTGGYGHWRVGPVAFDGEGAVRWGRSTSLTLVNETNWSAAPRQGDWFTAGGVLRFTTPGWSAGGVHFETTGLELGAFSGDDLAGVFTDRKWSAGFAAPDYHVGLLLFGQLWPARQSALGDQLASAYADRIGGARNGLDQTYEARTGAGLGNVVYAYPGFGLRTEDDLRFRFNVLYARALDPVATLEVVDDRNTAQRADDEYGHESTYGFELDAHLSYPLWGGVTGVLESGIAFPQGAFRNALGDDPPIAFMVAPRLTVGF